MKCQKCGKYDATMHLTEVINGVKNETYLCKYCADEENKGFAFKSPFYSEFDNFFQSFWESPKLSHSSPASAQSCSGCGSTLSDIQKRGRLGCAECYRTFRDLLLRPLKEIHGSNTHTGKIPKRIGKGIAKLNEIDKLKDELSRAVLDQNFEKAAELRDRIREMEN